MTIPVAIIISVLFGASVAFGARVQIRTLQRSIVKSRYFLALLLLEAMLVIPVQVYFLVFYPDWAWMYLVDVRTIPWLLHLMAVLSLPVCGAIGYLVGYFSARSRSDWVTVVFMVSLVLAALAVVAVGVDQMRLVGTFEQFRNQAGLVPWTRTSLLPSVVVAWPAVMVGWGFVVWRFWKEGKNFSVSMAR